MISTSSSLTSALQKVVLELEDDLRVRVEGDVELRGRWVVEHSRAVQRGRTAAAWVAWRDDRVTQAAVGWVLTSVFVRFCEDNGLVRPVWIAGPEHRRQEALDAQLAFFRAHPMDTDREWLLQAVQHLASLPATAELVGSHAALHLVSPSGDAVTRLLAFWRQKAEDGRLVYDFTDGSLSTRFLGDLYQDLSAYAKATFALLQTPVFVEEFILDRTLEPALDDRPLEGFRMIDPDLWVGTLPAGCLRAAAGPVAEAGAGDGDAGAGAAGAGCGARGRPQPVRGCHCTVPADRRCLAGVRPALAWSRRPHSGFT